MSKRRIRGYKIEVESPETKSDPDKTGVPVPAATPPVTDKPDPKLLDAAEDQDKTGIPSPAAPAPPAEPSEIGLEGGEGPESYPTIRMNRGLSPMSDLLQMRRLLAESPGGEYTVLPARMASVPATPDQPRWRIDLWFDDPEKEPLKLEIADVTVIGRKVKADLDLDPHDAIKYGISRQHAMLRPSRNALHFFDLESTNGTQHNGVPVGPGVACALATNDVIKLGTLRLTVRHVERV